MTVALLAAALPLLAAPLGAQERNWFFHCSVEAREGKPGYYTDIFYEGRHRAEDDSGIRRDFEAAWKTYLRSKNHWGSADCGPSLTSFREVEEWREQRIAERHLTYDPFDNGLTPATSETGGDPEPPTRSIGRAGLVVVHSGREALQRKAEAARAAMLAHDRAMAAESAKKEAEWARSDAERVAREKQIAELIAQRCKARQKVHGGTCGSVQ